MRITKIHGSNHRAQNFTGRIIPTEALKKVVSRTLVGEKESVKPVIKMFRKIEKKLPKHATLEINKADYVDILERQLQIEGAIKTNSVHEPLKFAVDVPHKQLSFWQIVIMCLDKSVFGQIGKFHDYLGKKYEQIPTKINRKAFLKEIMSANKKLNLRINEEHPVIKANYITDEILEK